MTEEGEPAYLNMASDILEYGAYRKPDGEEGRYELFDRSLTFDLSHGQLPLLTTKRVPFKLLAVEMLWFISGSQRIDFLHEHGVHIWDVWCNNDGVVGPLYGSQWRHWRIDPALQHLHGGATEIDQLANVIQSLRDRPEARSHCITAWRPDHLKAMAIKPCHLYLQFYRFGDEIQLSLTQRSCDTFLGVPFNIAQYALLAHLVAHHLGCQATRFNWHGMDVHIYENHVEQIRQQLERSVGAPPRLAIRNRYYAIDGYGWDDLSLIGYAPHGPLKGDISPQGTPGEAVEV